MNLNPVHFVAAGQYCTKEQMDFMLTVPRNSEFAWYYLLLGYIKRKKKPLMHGTGGLAMSKNKIPKWWYAGFDKGFF